MIAWQNTFLPAVQCFFWVAHARDSTLHGCVGTLKHTCTIREPMTLLQRT